MSETMTMTKPFVFTPETLTILKNFSSINQSIFFQKGNTVRTISNQKTCAANAVISEEIPTDFAIFNLPAFLSAINLFDQPTLLFNEGGKFVKIVEGNKELLQSSLKHFFTEPSLITYPKTDISIDGDFYEFHLSEEVLTKIKKSAPVVKATSFILEPGKNGKLTVSVQDIMSDTNNSYQIDVDAGLPSKAKFKFIIDLDNLNILNLNYKVKISEDIIEFQSLSKKNPITYWIAANTKSTWG